MCITPSHIIRSSPPSWIGNYAENEEFEIIGIAQLERPPRSKDALKTRLIEFEGYWQFQLGTISPKGMNVKNELKESFNRSQQHSRVYFTLIHCSLIWTT